MKLLLINPKFPESFWSFKWAVDKILPEKRTINPPLGLATLAALCPEEWEVEIVDENIQSVPLEPNADLIGICGMGVQFARQKELLRFYRGQGRYVVAGGSYASLCPEYYHELADTVVSGEAEYIWPQFCRDFENGRPGKFYEETGVVDLTDSPTPRFDLLQLEKYQSVSLQFSRGCPYRCEFCDIIVMFGRKPRTKTMEQVGRELDCLRALNANSAFFVDDNLIGNKPQAKALMRFLRDYQQKHDYQFHFGTEASLNMAQDEELLELFRAANFEWVFVGIESPDEESLKETKKFQNTREDILTSVRKIYAYGLEILAGFIVGFDNDSRHTFDLQYRFITDSGIQAAMIGLLTAPPKTPLYKRLQEEGRLIPEANSTDNTKLGTNIIPKRMSYDEMVSGYHALHTRLLSHKNIATRIRNKIRYLRAPNYSGTHPAREQLGILRNFFIHGLVEGGPSRLFHFLRSFPFLRPRLIHIVLQDWIIGLSMRDYVERHFIADFEKFHLDVESYLARIEQAFQRYLHGGSLEVSLEQAKNAVANLSISMKGMVDKAFYRRAGKYLEKVLEDTSSSVTLRIEAFQEVNIKHFNRLLKRLSRHGDRVYIMVHEKLLPLIEIDSSVFNLVLEPAVVRG